MKRFPRLALLVPVAVVGACAPNNSVQPGSPVLMSLAIVESSGKTQIDSTTGDCASGTAEGNDCDPAGSPCRLAKSFCHCVPKAMGDCSIDMNNPATGGTYACHYGPGAQVLATFDRLLDTTPLDPGDAGAPRSDIVMFATSATPSSAVVARADYNPDGSQIGLVFPLFGNPLGPSLLISADPAVPAGANVTFTLDPTKVRAKDGKSYFTASGLLQGGAIQFDTAPFQAGITVPVAPPPMPADGGTSTDDGGGADGGVTDDGGVSTDDGGLNVDAGVSTDDGGMSEAGEAGDAGPMCVPPPPPPPPLPVPSPNMDPVTVAFNNPVDPTTIVDHIKLTANGTAIPATDLTVDASMAPSFTITPMTAWPPSATIEVSVDADASDVLGDKLGADATASFTTTAGM
jgi:hypothetical protein